jgi:hypothetical protein
LLEQLHLFAMVTSPLRTTLPFHVVRPMFGSMASARSAISSGAVRPVTARVLEPLGVEHEAFQQILVQAGGGPLAELRAAGRAHAITDGENGREGSAELPAKPGVPPRFELLSKT